MAATKTHASPHHSLASATLTTSLPVYSSNQHSRSHRRESVEVNVSISERRLGHSNPQSTTAPHRTAQLPRVLTPSICPLPTAMIQMLTCASAVARSARQPHLDTHSRSSYTQSLPAFTFSCSATRSSEPRHQDTATRQPRSVRLHRKAPLRLWLQGNDRSRLPMLLIKRSRRRNPPPT